MPNPKCAVCGKTAYPLESLTALEQTFHKLCFKCVVCKSTLNLKNYKGFEGQIYCSTHTPKVKATSVADSVTMKAALSAPKKESGVRGIHKADPSVAPKNTGDFTVNETGDQSVENNPEESSITYEERGGDQSIENQPQESSITYEEHGGDQSRESEPTPSGITYDSYPADQSTGGGEEYEE